MLKLLILGAGYSQRPIYEAARRLGLSIVGADPDDAAPALTLAEQKVVCDLADADLLLRVARAERVAGALTFAADYPMPSLARVWSELGLTGPDESAVRRATHKGAMRAAFNRSGVPSPMSTCLQSTAELWREVRHQTCGLIVKPMQSSGGRGVTRLSAGCDQRSAAEAYKHAASFAPDRCSVLLEHYIGGPEYSIESVIFQGQHRVVAVTDKLTSQDAHCVEIGHHQPASLCNSQREALCDLAGRAVAALGIDNAVCHTEAKLAPTGPVVIECAARAGGGFIASHLVPLSTGVDLMGAAIQIALGRAPSLQPVRQGRPVAIRSIVAAPGRIVAQRGMDEASSMEGVVDVQLYKRLGDNVLALKDATARCGHVIAVGPDVDSAIARASSARDVVRVVTQLT